MKNGLDYQKGGMIFLLQIITTIGVSLWLSFGRPFFQFGILANMLLSEVIILIPGILFVVLFENNLFRNDYAGNEDGLIAMGHFSFWAILLVPLFTFLSSPLITVCNAVSMLFTENEVASLAGDILELPFITVFLIIGIAGPICEELAFRGVIYGAFRRSGRVRAAIFLQALLFGLMHLNFNQFCYAIIIGILMGILVEATGTILSSIIMHVLVNGTNVVLMYASGKNLTESAELMENGMSSQVILLAICFYSIIALFTTTLALMLVFGISRLGKRENYLLNLLKPSDGGKVFSVYTIIGVILAFGIIIFQLFMEHFFG